KTAQFYWYLGHLMEVFSMVSFTVSNFLPSPISSTSKFFYTLSIFSIILTYSIVILKTYPLGFVKTLFSNPLKIINDNNVQYLLLSIFFYLNFKIQSLIQGSLYPFTIYSVFHSLNYFRDLILPILPLINTNLKTNINTKINYLIKNYYETSLTIAANSELIIIFQLVMDIIKKFVILFIYRNTLLISEIFKLFFITSFYLIFIKIRYNQNNYMKNVVNTYDYKINVFLSSNQRIPSFIQNFWYSIRHMIIFYLSPISLPSPPNRR
ncbi:uncharacterized protein ASCRUDRAFT_36456, partial [Ascoidea rubescens DSM 1968]